MTRRTKKNVGYIISRICFVFFSCFDEFVYDTWFSTAVSCIRNYNKLRVLKSFMKIVSRLSWTYYIVSTLDDDCWDMRNFVAVFK